MNELATTDQQAAMLALIERGELTTTLSAEKLRQIEKWLTESIELALVPMQIISGSCGPELHGVPAHLSWSVGTGTGYLRHARDVIRALRTAKGRKGRR